MAPSGPIKTTAPWGAPFGLDWSVITQWTDEAGDAATEFGVPIERTLATICIESGGNPEAQQINPSNGNSYGLMQIVAYGVGWEGWWRRVAQLAGMPANPTRGQVIQALGNPATNVRVGCSILRDLKAQHGSWDKASSAFFLGNPDWRGSDTVNGNTGAAYRSSLNGLMEEYLASNPPSPLPYRMGLIPVGNPNRPGTAMNAGGPRYITVHETGNTNRGANAEMHRIFVRDGGGASNVSFHLVVDDKEAIQLLPFTEIGWHASDGCDNRSTDLGCFDSIAIETCVNSDGNWERTFRNLALLIAKLIRENPTLSDTRIRQHNTWAADRKNCPQKIRESGRWDELIRGVRAELSGVTPPPPGPAFPGLPAWLPEPHFRAAFPLADPTGVVTKAVVAWAARTGRVPVYREHRSVTPTSSLWLFDGATFLHDGPRVWVEGETL